MQRLGEFCNRLVCSMEKLRSDRRAQRASTIARASQCAEF